MRQDEHLSALHPGARLQTYTIAAILGAGGFGITYRAVEDITNRDVAIKEYLPAAFAVRDRDGATVRPLSEGAARDYAWGLERFRDEAKLLIGFRHPAIVPVLAYFEANGTGYLVMGFEDGISLGAALNRTPALSEAETLAFVVPLLDGVEEVHRHKVLHRDIKPDNIFIRGDGSPVLLDFGAAREALGARSRAFTTLVTEGYAPFEQYAGTGNQGPWSDIYALAAVMFRCLAGKAPVEAPRRAAAKLRGAPDPMAADFAALRRRVSSDLAFAIEAGMRVVEHERPQSIAAFREMIVSPAPGTVRPPAESAPAAAPMPTLIPDAALRLQPDARHPPPGVREKRRRPRRLAYFGAAGALLAAVASGAAYVGDQRSWLPGAFRRAEPETAPAAKAPAPAAKEARRAAETRLRAERQAADARRAQGLAEYQRLQLEQAEAEWRQSFEARKAPESREQDEQRRVEDRPAAPEVRRETAPDTPPSLRRPPQGELRGPPAPPELPGRAPRTWRDPYYEGEY